MLERNDQPQRLNILKIAELNANVNVPESSVNVKEIAEKHNKV